MCPCFRPSGLQKLCRRVGCSCAGGSKSWGFLVIVPVVVFVTPLALSPAAYRFVAAPLSFCSISCWYWDNYPKSLPSPVFQIICPPVGEVSSVEGPKMSQRWFYRPRFVGSRSDGSPCLVMMQTWCPPVGVGYGSRASDRLANQVSSEHFFCVWPFCAGNFRKTDISR